MKKTFGILVTVFILSVFITVLCNSTNIFETEKETFIHKSFNSEVVKIVHGRGTKIFYNENDYFLTDFCVDSEEIENAVKVGDVVKKQDSVIEIFRENKVGEMEKILISKMEK